MSIYRGEYKWTNADCGKLAASYRSLLSHHKQRYGVKRRQRRNWIKDAVWIWVDPSELSYFYDSAKD